MKFVYSQFWTSLIVIVFTSDLFEATTTSPEPNETDSSTNSPPLAELEIGLEINNLEDAEYPPKSVTITAPGPETSILPGLYTFICETALSNPAATINWYFYAVLQKYTTTTSEGTANGGFIAKSQHAITVSNSFAGNEIKCEAVWKGTPGAFQIRQLKLILPPEGITDNLNSFPQVGIPFAYFCNVTSNPKSTIAWEFEGRDLQPSDWSQTDWVNSWRNAYSISSCLKVSPTRDEIGKLITCTITWTPGVISQVVTTRSGQIQLAYPPTKVTPSFINSGTLTVVDQSNTTFTCAVSDGRPSAVVQWQLDDNIIDETMHEPPGKPTDGPLTSYLKLKVDRIADGQRVYCMPVWRGTKLYSLRQYVLLNVHFPPSGITTNLKRTFFEAGKLTKFQCTSLASNPAIGFEWKFDGDVVPGIETITDPPGAGITVMSQYIRTIGWEDNGKTISCTGIWMNRPIAAASQSAVLNVKDSNFTEPEPDETTTTQAETTTTTQSQQVAAMFQNCACRSDVSCYILITSVIVLQIMCDIYTSTK